MQAEWLDLQTIVVAMSVTVVAQEHDHKRRGAADLILQCTSAPSKKQFRNVARSTSYPAVACA
jgi:hypothetical protein